jgi:hypothetical protein
MDITAFKATLNEDGPPDGLSLAVQALWHASNGHWDQAHDLAQGQDDAAGAWVHAYLHRVEGDLRNAGHWYRRAAKDESTAPLAQEWDEIASALL